MRNTSWNRAHTLGVPEVDDEHEAIFGLCSNLHRALRDGSAWPDVAAIANRLVQQTVQHFSHEDREMRVDGYGLFDWHHGQHRTAQTRIKAFERRIRVGDREAATELVEFLPGWLHSHIGLADRMLGAHLRNRRRQAEAHAR